VPQSDESALIALSHRYADAVRRADPDAWVATWATDAVWVLGPGRRMVGHDEIVGIWKQSLAKNERVVQLYLSSSYTIEGDEASGRIQLVELIRLIDGSAKMLAGHYDDRYVRTNGGWLFSERVLTQYYSGLPDLSGVMVIPSSD
jgi:ketosteroid isomerase-like protein